jgi:tetraacyldisaccharide 4'-kinase
MDQQAVDEILSGRRRGPVASLLRGALWACSVPYGQLSAIRRKCYRAMLLPTRHAGAPVISVGNVTAGGTGKTPMVAWLARKLAAAGARPAILTRGDKSSAGVSDEAELLASAAGCAVIVGADRIASAARAVDRGADVLVLDDGFQHHRLARDLDIVLIDATRPFGYGFCLPRGLLREPVSALADADCIVITRSDEGGGADLDKLLSRLTGLGPHAQVYQAVHRPAALLGPRDERRPPDSLAGAKVAAFCGIGNPGSFFATLTRLGADVVWRRALADHVAYAPAELARLSHALSSTGAEFAVTTEKDFVKLRHADLGIELRCLTVEMVIADDADPLEELIVETWRAGAAS